jgi:hypothetical protein
MKRALLAPAMLVGVDSSAWATWSVIAVDKKTEP